MFFTLLLRELTCSLCCSRYEYAKSKAKDETKRVAAAEERAQNQEAIADLSRQVNSLTERVPGERFGQSS